MIAQAKRIYILMIKINKLFSFLLQYILKEMKNLFFMFLWGETIRILAKSSQTVSQRYFGIVP